MENLEKIKMTIDSLSYAIAHNNKALARACISSISQYIGIEEPSEEMTPVDALKIICSIWGVTQEEVLLPQQNKSRPHGTSDRIIPRYVYMSILFNHFRQSSLRIGKELRCNHATVLYAKKCVENWVDSNREMRLIINGILSKFENKRTEDEF